MFFFNVIFIISPQFHLNYYYDRGGEGKKWNLNSTPGRKFMSQALTAQAKQQQTVVGHHES